MEQCRSNKLLAKALAVVIPACQQLIAILFWNGYSDFYNANTHQNGDNAALKFVKKAIICLFAIISCAGIGANIAMMLLN